MSSNGEGVNAAPSGAQRVPVRSDVQEAGQSPERRSLSTLIMEYLPIVVAGTIILPSSLVDIPRRLEVGQFTFLSLLTGLDLLLGVSLLWLAGRDGAREVLRLWPLYLFIVWAVLSFTWYRPTTEGIQNVLVLATFVLLTTAFSIWTRRRQDAWSDIGSLLLVGICITAVLYAATLAMEGIGRSSILTNRPAALFLLIGLSWTLAAWRYGSRLAGIVSLVVLVLILLSLSRMAFAVAVLVLVPLSQWDPRKWRRSILVLAAVALIFALTVAFFEPLHERFVKGDVQRVAGVKINVTGRFTVWRMTWASFRDSPWTGHGPGSSQHLVEARTRNLGHPHNEILRILHDYGLIGFALGSAGFLLLGRGALRAWRRAERHGSHPASVHLAALLGLVAVVAAVTSNPLIYVFIMGPLAILVGASRGADEPAGAMGS
jgi:O-antigen ligase